MNKQINLDEVFRNGMKTYEEPFDEKAWTAMQSKLGVDSKRIFWLSFFKRRYFNLWFLFSFVILGISSFMLFNGTYSKNTGSMITKNNVVQKSGNASVNEQTVNNPVANKFSVTKIIVPKDCEEANLLRPENPAIVNKSDSILKTQIIENETGTLKTPTQMLTIIENKKYRPRFRKGKVPKDFYALTVNTRPNKSDHYNCATIGIHVNELIPVSTYAKTGQSPGTGIDFEVYARSLTPSRSYGIFIGATGSIVGLGRGFKSDITLNTKNNDPGKTFLQSEFGELNFIERLEFGRGDLKFYLNAFGGWRCLFISQEIESNKPINGFENSSKNVWTRNMLQWGGGIGLRYHIVPGVSIDLRGTYQDADYARIASVKNSEYNGLTGKYNMNYNFIQPQMVSIKLGVLFCIEDMSSGSGNRSMGSRGNSRVHINIPSGGGGGRIPLGIKVPNVGR